MILLERYSVELSKAPMGENGSGRRRWRDRWDSVLLSMSGLEGGLKFMMRCKD